MVPLVLGYTKPLLGFYLRIPMRYAGIAPLFSLYVDNIVDFANSSWCAWNSANYRPLDLKVDITPATNNESSAEIIDKEINDFLENHLCFLTPSKRKALLCYINVHTYDFIDLCHGTWA